MGVRPFPDITEDVYNELKRLPGNDFTTPYDVLLEVIAQHKRNHGEQAKAIKVDPREFIAYCEKSKSHFTRASLQEFLMYRWENCREN